MVAETWSISPIYQPLTLPITSCVMPIHQTHGGRNLVNLTHLPTSNPYPLPAVRCQSTRLMVAETWSISPIYQPLTLPITSCVMPIHQTHGGRNLVNLPFTNL
ncbi:hypothetical protein PoB_002640700 [Plakobranchus ocellatus]|uniref:Uncharacterized protein n=1 Tax=Plakobranchus ocellatus TaxID=259542 RepID=A0AAV3ZXV8_9GAST|nr:hypothetical protein PoB_002640700 [Plakobranchus ocellatus]